MLFLILKRVFKKLITKLNNNFNEIAPFYFRKHAIFNFYSNYLDVYHSFKNLLELDLLF